MSFQYSKDGGDAFFATSGDLNKHKMKGQTEDNIAVIKEIFELVKGSEAAKRHYMKATKQKTQSFNQQLKARCQIVFDYVYIRWSQLEASGELQHGQCSMHPRTQLNQMCWKVVNDTINDTIGADNIAKLSRKETKKIKDVFNTLGNEKLGPRDTTRTSRTEESVPAAGGDTLPHIRKRKRPDVLSPSSKSTRNPSKLRKPSRKKKRDQYEQFVHEWYDKKILEEEKLFVSKNMCNLDESNGLREEHERRFPGEKLAPSPGDIFDLGNQVATESQDYSGSRPACNLEQSVFEDLINQYLAGLLPDHRVESVTGFGNSLRTKKPMSQGEATLLYPGKHMYSLHAPLTHEKGGDCVVTLLQHNKDARKDLVISPVCGAGQFAHYANSPSPRGNDYKNANCVPVVVSLYAKDPSDNKRKYITALFLVCIKRITAGGHLIWYYGRKYFDDYDDIVRSRAGQMSHINWGTVAQFEAAAKSTT